MHSTVCIGDTMSFFIFNILQVIRFTFLVLFNFFKSVIFKNDVEISDFYLWEFHYSVIEKTK